MAAATPDLLVLGCKVLQVLFALLGLPLNGYTLLLVLFGRPTVYSCLLLCMALSHLLFDVFVAAFELAAIILVFRPLPPDIGNSSSSTTTITTTAEVLWPQPWPPVLRRLQICLWVVMPVVNLWIICALVLDRYLVIMRPWTHDDKLSRTKVLLLSLFTTLLILAGSVPFWSSLFSCTSSSSPSFSGSTPKANYSFGILDLSDLAASEYSAFPLLWTVYIAAILVPSTVMLLCNSHLLFIILQHRSRILSTIYVVQLSSSASTISSVYGGGGDDGGGGKYLSPKAIHQSEQQKPQQQQQHQHKQRDLLLTTVHLFCSLLLVLPYSVWTVTSQMLFSCFHLRLTAATQLVLTLTPLYNCYNYGLRSPPVKKVAFHRALQVRSFDHSSVRRSFWCSLHTSYIYSSPDRAVVLSALAAAVNCRPH